MERKPNTKKIDNIPHLHWYRFKRKILHTRTTKPFTNKLCRAKAHEMGLWHMMEFLCYVIKKSLFKSLFGYHLVNFYGSRKMVVTSEFSKLRVLSLLKEPWKKNELSVNPQWLRAKAYYAIVFSGREKIIDRKQVGLIWWCYSVFLKLIIISHSSVRRTQKCLSIGQEKRSQPVSDAQSMLVIANARFLDKLMELVSLEWSTMLLWID